MQDTQTAELTPAGGGKGQGPHRRDIQTQLTGQILQLNHNSQLMTNANAYGKQLRFSKKPHHAYKILDLRQALVNYRKASLKFKKFAT